MGFSPRKIIKFRTSKTASDGFYDNTMSCTLETTERTLSEAVQPASKWFNLGVQLSDSAKTRSRTFKLVGQSLRALEPVSDFK